MNEINVPTKLSVKTDQQLDSTNDGHQIINDNDGSCSYYSLTSSTSTSTSCDNFPLNIASDSNNIEFYNHNHHISYESLNNNNDKSSFINHCLITKINMDQYENKNDDEECIIHVFHKIESLLMSKYPDHWEMLNYLFRDEQYNNIVKAEKFITNDCLCEYICLLQQLFQLKNNLKQTNDDQRDQQEIYNRIRLFCRKLMAKYPNIVSMFIPQLASLLKMNNIDDNSTTTTNNGVGPNLYFSNVIKTNLFYSDSNRIEVPISDKDLYQLIDWLYPDYNLPKLFQFIENARHILKDDLSHLFNNQNNQKNNNHHYLNNGRSSSRTDPFSLQYTMPIIDHLLLFILHENPPCKQSKSTAANYNTNVQANKRMIVFCLRATIFEQTLQCFNHWIQQFNANIINTTNIDDNNKQQSSSSINGKDCHLSTVDRKDNIDDNNGSRLWSSYLVNQLYRLAIDLALLCSSFNHLDLVNQFLSLHVADLDLTENLEYAMKAINFELNDENGTMFNEHHYLPQAAVVVGQTLTDNHQQIVIDQSDSLDEDDDDNDSLDSFNMQLQPENSNDNDNDLNQMTLMLIKRQLLEKIQMNGQRLEAPINNRWSFDECCICCENRWLLKRICCCSSGACLSCLNRYYTERIRMGQLSIECIGPGCKSLIYRAEVLARLNGDNKALYGRLLLSQSNESDRIRPCPRCNRLYTLSSKHHTKMKYVDRNLLFKRLLMCGLAARLSAKQSKSFKVKCEACHYDWCFKCHSPWHEGISCSDYIRGDRLLKTWAKHSDLITGDVNAQKCPKCKIYIQRINGCDHMHCIRCKSDFCYRCGDSIRHVRFFGDHYSRFSVFGCKYRYKPKNPLQRKFVRGAVLGSKLMVLPVLTTVCLCTGILVLAFGVAAMPFIGGIYCYNYVRNQRHRTMVHLYNYSINRQDRHIQHPQNPRTIAIINDGNNQSIPSSDINNDHQDNNIVVINVKDWQSMYVESLPENITKNNDNVDS
ncbi:uncharacterized protein LOC113789004 [Dermatophagoides pteronyssinus]|uniref:uncharacterized protein LOC113789004 n=1 Tax=Dermatophagoides pteronyssinus TaxID=6956 RepID=UPI003F677581